LNVATSKYSLAKKENSINWLSLTQFFLHKLNNIFSVFDSCIFSTASFLLAGLPDDRLIDQFVEFSAEKHYYRKGSLKLIKSIKGIPAFVFFRIGYF
jgi:hypothetical protein